MNKPILGMNKGDAPFSKQAARSFTLPARFYHDTEIYELEKDAIFARNWWYAGHNSQLA
ncbi:MAG: aromatic ring-hydroxylating dioxygenase subunit alpha, partial [Rhizobiales bacterium]|nr:aromatic ring-hydroxylating dioxygenase subunit alpha [Hyphomicrobiales bacterium]